jgi:hypothetical protein
LGGGAYAALTLPRNSVGARQIKSGAVRASEVKDQSLLGTDFAPGQLPAGPRGLPGPAGPGAARLNYSVQTNGFDETLLATVGGYTFTGYCTAVTSATLGIGGPAAYINSSGVTSLNDGPATPYTDGFLYDGLGLSGIVAVQGVPNGSYGRDAGTAYFAVVGTSTLLQVNYNVLLDERDNTRHCSIWGTVIPTSSVGAG